MTIGQPGAPGTPGEAGEAPKGQEGGAGGAGGVGGAGGAGEPVGPGGAGGGGGGGGRGAGAFADRFPPNARRLAGYVAIVLIFAVGLYRVESVADEAHETAGAVERQSEAILDARRRTCLQTRSDTRLAIIETIRYAAEQENPPPSPAEVEAFIVGLEPLLEARLPDSFCSSIVNVPE